jgi:hypothetical protein
MHVGQDGADETAVTHPHANGLRRSWSVFATSFGSAPVLGTTLSPSDVSGLDVSRRREQAQNGMRGLGELLSRLSQGQFPSRSLD